MAGIIKEQKYATKPLCSIVCTSFNHAAFSETAIASLKNQTYENIEIIVVDDGSTDGNSEIVERALRNSQRPYKFISQSRTGNVSKNINKGISVASGQYLSFFSLDDVLLEDCIESKMSLLSNDLDLSFVANTCNKEINEYDDVIEPNFKSPLFNSSISSADDLLKVEYENIGTFYMQGAVFSASLIKEIKGYDEDMLGDDLIIRTKIYEYMRKFPNLRFKLIHSPGVCYRKHSQNIHRDSWRQVKLVIEWRDRYFPGREMPKLWEAWVLSAIKKSLAQGEIVRFDLDDVLASSTEIKQVYLRQYGLLHYIHRVVKGWLYRSVPALRPSMIFKTRRS